MKPDPTVQQSQWIVIESRQLGRHEAHSKGYKAAIESPLRIVISGDSVLDMGLYMRTPGNDRELVTGLLYNEGIIEDSYEILALDIEGGVARVSLPEERLEGLMAVRGPLIVPGSCGVCGRLSLHKHKRVVSTDLVSETDLYQYHQRARSEQNMFNETGGTHSATAYDRQGVLLSSMEDVGRHNAMDKLSGVITIKRMLPSVCILSGRISYELVQKALTTGYSIVSGVGSATSLAVELAKENDLTLISFSRRDRMTILSAPRRVIPHDI